MLRTFGLVAIALTALWASPSQAVVRGKPVHGLALYGEPKYGPDFKHFDYVNPDAPKGGSFTRGYRGSFDSFNAFSFKGNPVHPTLLAQFGNDGWFYFNEALMVSGFDEPFSKYCLICETVELAEDGTWIEYVLRPEARFHDGSPVTPEDVIFSWETLVTKGHPRYKLYWGDISRAEKTGPRKVRFHIANIENAELPLLVGEIPVLSKKFWEGRDFQAGTLDIPVATGPYKIDRFESGRFVVFKRDPNYWGKDLPATRGAHNFDEFRAEYFRDYDVMFQAFMNGSLDFFPDIDDATRWATGYDQRLLDSGVLVKYAFNDSSPDHVRPIVLNLRRAKFADPRVRRALALAFDFDGVNTTVAHGLYYPFTSYWQGSEMASSGLPQGQELAILEKYRGRIPDEVFTTPFETPRTNSDGALRSNLLKAQEMLAAAGWTVRDGNLVNGAGEQFEIEFLLRYPLYERWVGPYLQSLKRLGINGTMRTVDPAQYLNRMAEFDFDATVPERNLWGGQSESPGNEQREKWTSTSADAKGSENWGGIKNPVIDQIVEDLIASPTRETLVTHTRALDRVMLANHYTIPGYVEADQWWAYWDKLGRPEKTPSHGPRLPMWWADAAKAATIDARRVAALASTPGDTGSGGNWMWALAAVAALTALFVVMRRRKT